MLRNRVFLTSNELQKNNLENWKYVNILSIVVLQYWRGVIYEKD